MQDIRIARNNVNIEALAAELQAALGNLSRGMSTGPYGVVVHLDDRATAQQIAQAQTIVENHDPTVLTPEQQARQQRQQRLDDLRDARGGDLDLADYNGQDAAIQTLAQKLAWLEQEVIDLRGGSDA